METNGNINWGKRTRLNKYSISYSHVFEAFNVVAASCQYKCLIGTPELSFMQSKVSIKPEISLK